VVLLLVKGGGTHRTAGRFENAELVMVYDLRVSEALITATTLPKVRRADHLLRHHQVVIRPRLLPAIATEATLLALGD
jgi:hypothetical protein